LDILKLSEEERRAYERYQDDLHYQASMVESSYTIGVKKGEDKKALQIAINLIKKGVLDAQEIAELTELPLEKIQSL
jgi:predicted HTH domain antitoxin